MKNLIGIKGEINCGKDTVGKMIQYYFACENQNKIGVGLEYSLTEFLSGNDKYYVDYISTPNLLKDGGNSISNDSNWKIKKFAAKLKQICASLVGCKESDFESQEFKNSLLPDIWQNTDGSYNTKRTYRNLLQQVGTDAIRNNVSKDVWVNALFSNYICNENDGEENCDLYTCLMPNWIISDLRFINEAKAIKDRNGIILEVIRNQESSNSKSEHQSEVEQLSIIPDFIIYNNGTIDELYANVVIFIESQIL